MSKKVLLGFALILLVSACGGRSQQSTEIAEEATDFAYIPLSITIPAGQPVTLMLKNSGKVEHDFVIAHVPLVVLFIWGILLIRIYYAAVFYS